MPISFPLILLILKKKDGVFIFKACGFFFLEIEICVFLGKVYVFFKGGGEK